MSLHLVESIMTQTEGQKLDSILPWEYGEVLLELRLPEIVKIIREHNQGPIVIFTNGSLYENRRMLATPGITEVHFTVNAATPETYLKIHRVPLYRQVVKTIEWLEAQPNHPEICLRFVACGMNLHELEEWKTQWSRFKRFVNRVIIAEQHPNYEELRLPDSYVSQINDDQTRDPGEMPCIHWGMAYITVNGYLTQCCMAPCYFGNVNEKSIKELWQLRNRHGMRNSFCQNCPLRQPDWQARLRNLLS